jgi:putative transposase
MIRELSENTIYHIFNRGVSKMEIYLSDNDYQRFIKRIYLDSEKYSIEILNYCLMPNHYHLMINAKENDFPAKNIEKNGPKRISLFMKNLQTAYAQYFNIKYTHSGHVFQGSYRIKEVLDDSYVEALIYYINNNPVRKGFVKTAEEWPFSSCIINLNQP